MLQSQCVSFVLCDPFQQDQRSFREMAAAFVHILVPPNQVNQVAWGQRRNVNLTISLRLAQVRKETRLLLISVLTCVHRGAGFRPSQPNARIYRRRAAPHT